MKPKNAYLAISPRYVKQDASGLRPFQRQTLEAIIMESYYA
jgi:hypothetical protein